MGRGPHGDPTPQLGPGPARTAELGPAPKQGRPPTTESMMRIHFHQEGKGAWALRRWCSAPPLSSMRGVSAVCRGFLI